MDNLVTDQMMSPCIGLSWQYTTVSYYIESIYELLKIQIEECQTTNLARPLQGLLRLLVNEKNVNYHCNKRYQLTLGSCDYKLYTVQYLDFFPLS